MPDTLSVDLLFDQVRDAVRRQEARLSPPFSYDLSTTADFTGLPVHLLRSMCRSDELQAFKFSGRWLLHRDEFNRLLAPDVALRFRAARQYILIRNLRELAAMLYTHAAESTLHVLLHDLRRAIIFREGGACYDDAEGMVWARAEWRVEDGIIDPDQIEDALRLVQLIIQLGMKLLRNIDWRDGDSDLPSTTSPQTGVELAV